MNTAVPQAPQRDALSASAFSSLFLAVAGLRNYRAALAMLVCFLVAVLSVRLVGAVFGGSGSAYMAGALVALVLVFTGIHASGILLMDQARQIPPRTMVHAVLYGLLCVPKTIALMVLLALAASLVFAFIALLFWICRLPGLGPLLYAVALPFSVVLAGVALIGLVVGFFLALAAIWEGAGVLGATARVLVVIQGRLVEAILFFMVIAFLTFAVTGVLSMFLAVGFWPAAGVSMGVLSQGAPSLSGVTQLLQPQSAFGSSGTLDSIAAYAMAGWFGTTILWLVAITLAFQVALMGVNLAFLRLTEGMDSSAAEGALQAHMADARRKAAELGAKAKEASERARAQAELAMAQQREAMAVRAAAAQAAAAQAASAQAAAAEAAAAQAAAMASAYRPPEVPAVVAPPPATLPPSLAAAAACPACGTGVSAQDVFCGNCGHRLR